MKRDLVHRTGFYYGWVVLAAGILGLIMTSPGQTYAISMFIEHFIEALDLSRSEVSALYTAATLTASFGLPSVGRLIDRHGSRRAVTVIAIGFGLACIFLSSVQNAAMLLVGFFLVRLFGQGSLGLVSTNVINQWWISRRGRMMGIAGLFTALGGIGLFPPLIDRLIALVDWRLTLVFLGVAVLAVMLPAGAALFRDRPELYGLLPDGGQPVAGQQVRDTSDDDWPHHEAVRTRAFWLVAAGLSTVAMMITGLHFHTVSIFEAGGHDRTLAATMYIPMAIATALLALIGGELKDRLPVKSFLAAALALLGMSMLLARDLDSASVWTYALSLGATAGLFQVVSTVIWADLFGRKHLGAISGTGTTLVIAGSALGPLPLALAQGFLGNYERGLELLSLPPFLLALATLGLAPPRRAKNDNVSTHPDPGEK